MKPQVSLSACQAQIYFTRVKTRSNQQKKKRLIFKMDRPGPESTWLMFMSLDEVLANIGVFRRVFDQYWGFPWNLNWASLDWHWYFLARFDQYWSFLANLNDVVFSGNFWPVLVIFGQDLNNISVFRRVSNRCCVFCQVFDLYSSFPACNHIAE